MDDRTRQQIEMYLPHDPDPDLDFMEFYWLQWTAAESPRVIRVYALDVLPAKDGTEYGIYQKKGGRLVHIDAGYGNPLRGVRMSDLYDNKEDCREQSHCGIDWWLELREEQRKEQEL